MVPLSKQDPKLNLLLERDYYYYDYGYDYSYIFVPKLFLPLDITLFNDSSVLFKTFELIFTLNLAL